MSNVWCHFRLTGFRKYLKWCICRRVNPLLRAIYLLLLRVEVVVLGSDDLWVQGVRRAGGLDAGFLRDKSAASAHQEVVNLAFRVDSQRQKCARASFCYCVWSVLAVC